MQEWELRNSMRALPTSPFVYLAGGPHNALLDGRDVIASPGEQVTLHPLTLLMAWEHVLPCHSPARAAPHPRSTPTARVAARWGVAAGHTMAGVAPPPYRPSSRRRRSKIFIC